MKRAITALFVFALCLILTVPGWGRSGVFQKAYTGCVSKDALDEFVGAAIDKDQRQMVTLLITKLCFNLEGLEYSTVDIGFLTSKVRVYMDSGSILLYVTTSAIRD